MKHLYCTTCKFMLTVGAEEAKAYKANIPLHCGQPMVTNGGEELPVAEEPKKGLGGKSKKK